MIQKLFKTILGVILLLLFLVSLAPTLLSTSWGKDTALRYLNTTINGSLEATHFNFHLFGSQEIKGIELKDPSGKTILTADSASIRAPFLSLLKDGLSSGRISLSHLDGSLVADNQGLSNIQQALKAKKGLDSTFYGVTTPIALKNVNADIHLANPVMIQASGTTVDADLEGHFDIDMMAKGLTVAELKKLEHNPELIFGDHAQIKTKIKTENLPINLIDHFAALGNSELRGILPLLIGNKLDLAVDGEMEEQGKAFRVKIEAKSPNLNGNVSAIINANTLTVDKPSTIILTLVPELFEKLQETSDSLKGLTIRQQTQLLLALESLQIPYKMLENQHMQFATASLIVKGRIDLQKAIIQTNTVLGDIALQKFTVVAESPKGSPDLSLNVDGEASQGGKPIAVTIATTLNKTKKLSKQIPLMQASLKRIPLALADQLLGLNGFLVDAMGPVADMTVNAQVAKKDTIATLSFKSERLDIPAVNIRFNNATMTVEPIVFHYQMDPALSARIFPQGSFLKLPSNVPLTATLSIDPIQDFNELLDPSSLLLSGKFNADEILFQIAKSPETVSFQDLAILWKLDIPNKAYQSQFAGQSTLSNEHTVGTFKGELELKNHKVFSSIVLNQVSSKALNLFLQKPEIAVLLGPNVDLSLSTDLSFYEQPRGTVGFKLAGQQLSGRGQIQLGKVISLSEPLTLDITLTPERFTALRSLLKKDLSTKDQLTLIDDATIKLTLNSLQLPLGKASSIDLPLLTFKTTLLADKMAILDAANGQSLTFESISAELSADNLQRDIAFNIEGKQRNKVQGLNDFNIVGNLMNGINADGSVNSQTFGLNLDSKVSNLPLDLLCRVLCVEPSMNQRVQTLFGNDFNATIHVALKAMEGLVQATIDAQNGHIGLDATLSKGFLTLNRPFTSEFIVTPQLGKSILQEIFPLLSGIKSSDQPIKISIDNKGFSYPFKAFNIGQVRIAKANLSLGKVKFTNEGQLGTILSLLTNPNTDLISVWFTPLYLSLQDGNLRLERIDLLISDQFPVATWGTVNFVRDRVDMVIGLSGYALNHAFKLQLNQDALLQIALKGTTSNASIDKRKATTKIGALVAQSQGSPQGLVIGTVLNIASGGLMEDKAPAPTTSPLPWASQLEQQQKDGTSKTKGTAKEKVKQVKDLPLDFMEKGANKLLDKLFK